MEATLDTGEYNTYELHHLDINESIKDVMLSIAKEDIGDMVLINSSAIKALPIPSRCRALPKWDWCIDGRLGEDTKFLGPAMFWIVANSINFRFWSLEDGILKRYEHRGKTGSTAMMCSLREAWDDTASPAALRLIEKKNDWKSVFGDIPALQERVAILHEVLEGNTLEIAANILIDRCMTNRSLCIEDATLLGLFFQKAYGRDNYLKKAQIAISAIAGFIASKERGISMDLTAMADYQVPRVLRAMGIIEYRDDLACMVDATNRVLIDENSPEERAIRGSTIIACEKIAAAHKVNSVAVDHFLWSSQMVAGNTQFHLTETTNY